MNGDVTSPPASSSAVNCRFRTARAERLNGPHREQPADRRRPRAERAERHRGRHAEQQDRLAPVLVAHGSENEHPDRHEDEEDRHREAGERRSRIEIFRQLRQ